jgi:hypothetical protein
MAQKWNWKTGKYEETDIPGNTPVDAVTPVNNQNPQYGFHPVIPKPATSDAGGPDYGQYGQGEVYDLVNQLRALKSQVQSGSMSIADYFTQASPLAIKAEQRGADISSQGQSQANSVNPALAALHSEKFIKNIDGEWTPTVPFTEQEYSTLPENVKATTDQINKGVVPAGTLPGNIALNTTIEQEKAKQEDLYTKAQTESQDLFNQQMDVLQKALTNQREISTKDLTTGYSGQALKNQLNQMGILSGGAYESELAKRLADIQSGSEQSILGLGVGQYQNQQDIANQGLGVQSGLGTAGLGRQFSLSDFYNQSNLQQQLAAKNYDYQNSALNQSLNSARQNSYINAAANILSSLFSMGGKSQTK